jgi:hypothetical protein
VPLNLVALFLSVSCWLGRRPTGARGARGFVRWPLKAGTWRCCGGRGSSAARGTSCRCACAALHGHLYVLRLVREHHCTCDKTNAVCVGRPAREHHCPWDKGTCQLAHLRAGTYMCSRGAREHGCLV